MTGRELSADDIVNYKKEPITINLEVHEDFPDYRNISHAAITDVERKIAIPKNKLDQLYSVCEPESLHIKTLSEIQRERRTQGKLRKEKQKHRKGHARHQDADKMEVSCQLSSRMKPLRRKLVSSHTIEAQLNHLETLPANLVFAGSNPRSAEYGYENGFQLSKSLDKTVAVRKNFVATTHIPVAVNTRPRNESHTENRLQRTSRSQVNLEPQSSFVTLPSGRGKTDDLKSRGFCVNRKHRQPYRNIGEHSERRFSQTPTHKINPGEVQTSGHMDSSFAAAASTHPDEPSARDVNSTSIASRATQFWKSHTAVNGALEKHKQASFNRLHKVSDDLTGINDTLEHSRLTGHTMAICDVLNVSQEQRSLLNTSKQIKQEPVFEPATPPDSSDEDIIWDDEIAPDGIDEETNMLDLHSDEAFSDSEILLDRVDELLQQ